MAEKGEDGLKSKDDEEKSVVPVIPKKSEDNIVEKDEKKIGEKCAEKKENAASSKKKEEKSPKSVVSCETASKNERRLNTSIEKGNSGRTTKIPFLLEISPQKLVVPPSEPLKVTVRNPTEDTQTLRCTFDSYYFLVDFKDAKSSGQHGVTPAAAYGCYELGPGESCSLTVRTTDREIDQSVDLKTLMNGTYNVIKPFPHLPRLKDRRVRTYESMDFSQNGLQNIIDIAFYNYDRPEGFLRFQYRKKEKGSNAKWVVRRKQLHLTDDIRKMIRLEEQKSVEEEKGKEENETATDPNPPVYMKFHRMKWIYYATQRHQSWKGSWGEQLMNDDDGTHRVFPVRRDSAVEQFLKDKENYNKTLGTEEDNINFWTNVFVKEHIGKYAVDRNERKKNILDQNVGFGKHDFTAETLEESLEKAEKFWDDRKEEYLKEINELGEQERTQREKVCKKKKNNRKKIETQKAEDLKKEPEKKFLEREEELKTACEMVQPVKQVEEKKVEKREEKKKKKKNPCCSIL